MKRIGVGAVGVILLIAGCAGKPPSPLTPGCQKIESFFRSDLEAYQNKVDDISASYQIEQWKVETADPKASQENLSKLFVKLQEVSYDPKILEATRAVAKETAGESESTCPWKAPLARGLAILESTILTKADVIKKEKENQDKQDALIQKSNAYRLTIEGEKEPVSKAIYSKTLGTLPDRAKREKLYRAHNAGRTAKWLEWGFRELVRGRNEEAKLAGFKNFYEYRFFRNQLDFKNYRANVAEVKAKLAPRMRETIRDWGKKEKIKKVEAWDLRFLRERASAGDVNEALKDKPETIPMELARRFYAGLGIDVDSYQFTTDLFPRAGKNTHAFAMTVRMPRVDDGGNLLSSPKQDIRFLANLKVPVQWGDVGTVIHELGHAIHGAEVKQPIGLFRSIGSVDTEAIAMTLERMSDSSEFLGAALPQIPKADLAQHEKAARIEQAFTLLRQTFFSDFEYEIYRNPDADYAALWAKLHQSYWGVTVGKKDADWDVEHFLMAPVYVQNYALGVLMVEQLYASMLAEFKTSYQSKAMGDKLKATYFLPGVRYSYLELTQRFTGQPLTAAAALKLLD